MEPHEIAKLTDREILMLTCQKVHDTDGNLKKLDERVGILERGAERLRGAWLVVTVVWTAGLAWVGIKHK